MNHDPIRVSANHRVTKHLGNWTSGRRFEVRAHRGQAVLDLRSPQIPAGDIAVDVDIDHAVLKLLVADDAVVDGWDLRRTARGRLKDSQAPVAGDGRSVVLTGRIRHGEVRVHRGGVAILSAMFSRAYLTDLRRTRRLGGYPTVDDPGRDHVVA